MNYLFLTPKPGILLRFNSTSYANDIVRRILTNSLAQVLIDLQNQFIGQSRLADAPVYNGWALAGGALLVPQTDGTSTLNAIGSVRSQPCLTWQEGSYYYSYYFDAQAPTYVFPAQETVPGYVAALQASDPLPALPIPNDNYSFYGLSSKGSFDSTLDVYRSHFPDFYTALRTIGSPDELASVAPYVI
jgi:hypothetical protein